jgi:hypothetical protein
MIIFASLPIVRKFMNHLFPRLLGELPSNSTGLPPLQPEPGLVPWGGSNKNAHKYAKFANTLYGLDTN